MSQELYRAVDSRDTYTVVEFSNDEVNWEKATLDHIAVFSNRTIIYTGWTDTDYSLWSYARVKVDNNLAGWMPDDWRVLYDTEVVDSEDWFIHHESWSHGEFLNLIYSTSCRDYVGKTAKQAILEKPWFYAVVRPKFISVKPKDVGKMVLYFSPKVMGKLAGFISAAGCRPEYIFDEENGKRSLVFAHELRAINPAFQRNEAKKIHDSTTN